MITILAEKPSVAKDIAAVLGASKRNDGYFSNDSYNVTWSFGHLVALGMPDEYGIKEWSLSNLPILPTKFKLVTIKNDGVKKQLNVINKLFNNSNKIIVATDAGREGELIYRLIFSHLKPSINESQIYRLWISDLTPESIKDGFASLKPITDYTNLYYSAMARACADWLVGINFTQAITLSSKKNYPISIGRVQTPTLKIIVDRCLANKNFVSQDFYRPIIIFDVKGNHVPLSCKTSFTTEQEARLNLEGLPNSFLLNFENSKKNVNPPLLYDLTVLQKEAFASFKFTAQETLDLAQSLYEKKIITYPRTDSQYLASNQEQGVSILLRNVLSKSNSDPYQDYIDLDNIGTSKNFNNKKITDHHAIIPTSNFEEYSNCSDREIKLFYLIIKRFVESFGKTAINSNVVISTDYNSLEFSFNNTINYFLGWTYFTSVFNNLFSPFLKKKEEKEKDNYDFLFNCDTGQYQIANFSIDKGKTKAPALLNDSSLLSAMENSGKHIDKEIEEVVKDKGLGTPATRASIIEVLIKREYVDRVKNSLIATDLGISLIDALNGSIIVDAEFTAKMEYRLKMIEKGEESLALFMRETKDFVSSELENVVKGGTLLQGVKSEAEIKNEFTFGLCPKCKNGETRNSKKGAYCSNFKNEEKICDFFIFNKMASKKLSEKNIRDLITKNKTTKIKGFKSKAGKLFEAVVILDDEFKTKFLF